jgi:hypothetical protein
MVDKEDRKNADERAADEKLQEETLPSLYVDLELEEDQPGWEGTPTASSGPLEDPSPVPGDHPRPSGAPEKPAVAPEPGDATFPGAQTQEPGTVTAGPQGETVPAPEEPAPGDTAEETPKRPISPQKLAANRANAQHSTGPKTAEGKAKSRFNAVKYGLTSRYFPTLLQENSAWGQTYQDLRMNLYVHFAPEGPIEEMLVDKIVVETIRYSRLLSHEQHPDILKTHAYWEVLRLCTRYQSAINRQLFEAMQELERLQTKRKAEQGHTGEAAESDETAT